MFRTRQEYTTRWGLSVKESNVYLSTKEKAIKIGKDLLRVDPEVKMFEEYILWDLTPGKHPVILDEKRFDRTILIQ